MSSSNDIPVSWLFVPGDRPERFDKAATSGAHGIILDLEDAVSPPNKAAARENVIKFLDSQRPPVAVGVRINAPDTVEYRDDLAALSKCSAPSAIFIPKVEGATVVQAVTAAMTPPGTSLSVIPMIESSTGVLALPGILSAGPTAIMIGEADLSADLGCTATAQLLKTTTAMVLLNAASHHIPVIASPSFDIRDASQVRHDAKCACDNGYAAKAAIHPNQLPQIHRGFAPTAKQVTRAETITGVTGVGVVDGQMIDEAILRHARRVLSRAPLRDQLEDFD